MTAVATAAPESPNVAHGEIGRRGRADDDGEMFVATRTTEKKCSGELMSRSRMRARREPAFAFRVEPHLAARDDRGLGARRERGEQHRDDDDDDRESGLIAPPPPAAVPS